MGKPGAYLTVSREEHATRAPSEAVHDYHELALPLTAEAQQAQASRCMYCGVAFCQVGASFGGARPSGCPLHNLIPEWNDLVYRGLWDEAAERHAIWACMMEQPPSGTTSEPSPTMRGRKASVRSALRRHQKTRQKLPSSDRDLPALPAPGSLRDTVPR